MRLILECVNARDDSSRAVSEQIQRQPGVARFGQGDYACDIADVVGHLVYIESFTVRAPTSAQIQSVNREAERGELLADPLILTAARVEAVTDDDDRASNSVGTPGPDEDVQTRHHFNFFFPCDGR